MGSRQLGLFAALALIFVVGCKTDPPTAPPPAEQESMPTSQPSAESDGLVGTDVNAEVIEVVDEGPTGPVILFTAGLKGYTEPCGCTLDLVLGGIDRVTGYIAAFGELGGETLVLDVGNFLFEHLELRESDVAQEIRKTEVLLDAVRAAGTFATVPGPNDFANGEEFYRDSIASTQLIVVNSNLTIGDAPLGTPFATTQLGEFTVGLVGAVDPSGFEEVESATASDALSAVHAAVGDPELAAADVVILLFQGDLVAARTQLSDLAGVDFILIGSPRDTDEVEIIGSARTLEAFDQGRYIGRLKLQFADDGEWTNARGGSNEEVAQLERVITGIQAQLASMTYDAASPPPIVARQLERIETMQAELADMQNAELDFSAPRSFLYRPIAMEPGLPANEDLTESMRRYNAALPEINAANAAPPVPAAEGRPSYVGDETCASCHVAEHAFWETTSHAHAWDTLVERDKEWDRSCVGCHATGYDQPGGSTLGHTEGLTNVQCEQCHGPGSLHAADPTVTGAPAGVILETSEQTCVGCHNEEHSTTFDYATYLPRTLGPGHGE